MHKEVLAMNNESTIIGCQEQDELLKMHLHTGQPVAYIVFHQQTNTTCGDKSQCHAQLPRREAQYCV